MTEAGGKARMIVTRTFYREHADKLVYTEEQKGQGATSGSSHRLREYPFPWSLRIFPPSVELGKHPYAVAKDT